MEDNELLENDNFKQTVAEWIYRGKITIHDLPAEERREYYSAFYVLTFRRLRELKQVEEYVNVMRLLWSDYSYTKLYGSDLEAQGMERRLFDAYWGVELEFRGDTALYKAELDFNAAQEKINSKFEKELSFEKIKSVNQKLFEFNKKLKIK